MSSFYTGSGSSCQAGFETSYGTGSTMTDLINLTSESLKTSVEKGDEGSLLASKTAMSRDLLGITVAGDISFVLRPEFADFIFKASLGKVTEAEGSNTYTLSGTNEDLPTFAITLDRKAAVKKYTGCTISSLSIDAAANDYVKGTISIQGYKEETGTLTTLPSYTIPSYRCTSASFKLADKTYDVSSSSFKVDNKLETAPKTYSAGLYAGQPQHGQREVTLSMEIPYSAEIETLRSGYLTTEANGEAELVFTSTDTTKKVVITIPNLCITEVTSNVGGSGLISASVTGMALSVGNSEPVSVEVFN